MFKESGGSSHPTSSYTGDTSLTSDNPEYRSNISNIPPQHSEPIFRETTEYYSGNTNPFDLMGVQFPSEFLPNRVPQILDSDLHDHADQNDTDEDSPVGKHQCFQGTVNARNIGVAGRSSHSSRVISQDALLEEWRVLSNTLQALSSEDTKKASRDDMIQFQQSLDHWRENFNTIIHAHEPGVPAVEPLTEVPSAPVHSHKKRYQCRIPDCNSDKKFAKETFLRHVEAQHHPRFTFYCSCRGCPRIEARRDKMLLHTKEKHLKNPTRSEIDQKKKAMPCPPQCPICSLLTRSWPEFYRCIMKHSILENDGANEGSVPSERGNEGNSNLDKAPGEISSFPAAGAARAGEMATTQSQGGYGNPTSRRVSSTLLSPDYSPLDSNPSASGMLRGFSDGINMPQAPPNGLQGFQEGRRSSDSHLHPDVLQRPQHPQQPPPPPRPQPRQPDLGLQEQLQCQVCRHLFSRCCRQQNPREWCHECAARMLGIGLQIPRAPTSNQRGPSNAVAPMYQHMRSFGPPVNVPFREVVYQPQQPPHQRPSGGRGTSFQGLFGNHYNVSMLTSIDAPGLSEDNMEILLNSKATNLPFGLSSLGRLSTRVPLLKGMVGVPASASPIPLDYNSTYTKSFIHVFIGLDPIRIFNHNRLANLSAIVSGVAPQPQVDLPLTTIQDNQCRCPCRVKALERSYNKARVELAPGKILDVNMKILADDRPSHLLRTRVRVVVKLLKLRSSVARSSSKKKTEEEARAIKKALKTSLDVPEAESSSKFTTTKLIENIDDLDDPDGSDLDSDGTCSDTESITSSVSATSSISEFSVEAESKPGSPDVSGEPFPNEFNDFDDDSLPPSSFSDDTHDLNEMIPYHHEGCDHPFFTGEAEELFSDDLDDTSEETELEIALDLDLATCLSRLSILPDGLADFDQPGLDQKITDPNRIFEYFFRYILYVIVALSRSRKHGSPSFLE
ncbi:hypothetical protein N7456_000598 [Penicillium angulare]|uniref:C2H2-type domain-containing protein n=1 Tax=Penicillium angulare TaxID=116970 RepID=A0A9W9GCR4_9EURO|nr:hypothetical protein N7456_000598 [Penicillium angulare]